jgi:Domain of unknown function (DUF4337)
MAEIEIHHEHGHEADGMTRTVGMLVGVIGVALAFVTIAAHRQHTAAVMHRSEANDDWSYYQAKKIREHTSDVAAQLALALGTDSAKVDAAVAKFKASQDKYQHDADETKKEADAKVHETERSEHLALRFDLAEGFLELGLVLTSLYFLGRQKLFPVFGVSAAAIGCAIALSSLAI